jgi:avidin family protein
VKRTICLLFLSSLFWFSTVSTASDRKVAPESMNAPTNNLTPAGTPPNPALEGKWCNELGSNMELSVNGDDITGKYVTAVGDADGYYEIRGRRIIENDGSQVIGFVVAYKNAKHGNSHSVATWSGQLQIIDGQETITTLWLLTRKTAPKDNWTATQVNKNVFTRCKK